jgi:hypothetical protein
MSAAAESVFDGREQYEIADLLAAVRAETTSPIITTFDSNHSFVSLMSLRCVAR